MSKKNYVVVVELHGFQVSKSIKISYNKDTRFYLYPGEYFNITRDINLAISDLKSSERIPAYQTPTFFRFEVGNERFTYLICVMPIKLYTDERTVINAVLEFFNLFLRVNSFIFDFFITISKIFILQKQSSGYRLRRILEQNIIIDQNKKIILYFRVDRYGPNIEALLQHIKDSELLQQLSQLLYEFVAAVNTSQIETRIVLLWNFFEHITHIYSRSRNRNLLIQEKKFQVLKKKVSQIIEQSLTIGGKIPFNLDIFNHELNRLLNRLNEDIKIPIEQAEWRSVKTKIKEQVNNLIKIKDILIDGYDKKKIQELIIQKMDDFPPIKSLIELMCRDINFDLNGSQDRTIDIMKTVRNYLFHRSIRLEGLYEKIIRDFTDIDHFDFSSLKNEMKKFEELIRTIAAKLYKSELLKDKWEIGPVTLHTYNPETSDESSSQEYFINLFNWLKDTYAQEKRYSNILGLIFRNIRRYNSMFNNALLMKGCCFGEEDKQILQFNLQFNNKFHASGKFNGNISYPQLYNFFIKMDSYIEHSTAHLKFRTPIYISSYTNIHNIYIDVLDFWFT